MGNQPSNGIPGGPSQHGGGDDPRSHGHGSMPPGGYSGYSGAGYPGASPAGDAAYGVRGSVEYPQQQQQRPMQRTQSDTSMTLLDAEKSASAVTASDPGVENWLDDDTVPTVFRWEHGGRQVYITGTFNNWSRQIPMHRSGNDFTYIHNLKREKHAFKFIVDDEWRFAPDQPTVADIEGRINNFIDVTDFKPYTGDREFEKEKAAAEYGYVGEEIPLGDTTSGDESDDDIDLANRPDKDGEVFSQTMPDMDEYTKEPPPLPPHLRHIILNKPPQLQDTAALPVPQHVALNHLYCTAIKDNMMVLGITQRYKTKFVTTVYYSPCK
jgi:5'-AMP-activated protein kinase, regulatory beta subunit